MLLIPAPLPFNPTYISDMFEVQRIVDDTESVVISEDRETEIRITKKEANLNTIIWELTENMDFDMYLCPASIPR